MYDDISNWIKVSAPELRKTSSSQTGGRSGVAETSGVGGSDES